MEKQLNLMSELGKITEDKILPVFSGTLNVQSKKYAQLRLFGLAYIYHKDIKLLLSKKASRSSELLLRPLVEIYINYSWIGIGPGSKNYYMFVREDNEKMEKLAQDVISYIQRTGEQVDELEDWIEIKKMNRKQADECVRNTKFLTPNSKSPTLLEKAQILDASSKFSGGYEWLYRFPYSFTHHAVHNSNRQLNKMINDESNEIDLIGDNDECKTIAGFANSIYLGMIEDFCKHYSINLSTDKFWARV